MKIYVHDKGVTLSGKAWEIKQKLKEYRKDYRLVSDLVKNNKKNLASQPPNRSLFIFNKK
ncbi:Z-ring formation inhibitor MciZ [Bacillus sp. V3B]|uniref:Z-ring formation inhibitor MciZ n=1 Tax=Bacillus sp. V3B TaxID=2804915 RepID=UPI00210DC961|nr:Z-ring formation inhibitor MciZ [Bacillus sp. V3B]MCQ6273804.1 Z-ring formation inhibitor MciZ [Bacillus sp. V3B]